MSTMSTPAPPDTTSLRRAGRWMVACGATFVVGFVLSIVVPEGAPLTNISTALLLLAAVVLVVGVGRAAAAVTAGQRPLATGSVVLAVGCAAALVAVMGLSLLTATRQDVIFPLVIVSTACGGAAVAALAAALRARGIARRTGLVVAVLGVVTLLGCFVIDPVVPFVLVAVLGLPLARGGASATM